jgi:hypothetical protein
MAGSAYVFGVCILCDGQAEAAVARCLDVCRDGRVTQTFRPRSRRWSIAPISRKSAMSGRGFRRAGQASRCRWLSDKFGLSWQIVPPALPLLLARGGGVMQALMGMDRLDIAALERAGEK